MAREVYVGRVRSVVTHALLSLATLGIYFFVWYGMIHAEARKSRGDGVHPAVVLVVFLVLPVIGWFVSPFLTASLLRRVQQDADADKRVSPWYAALWALVPIVGWTVSAAVLQTNANAAWIRRHHDWHRVTSGPVSLECPQCRGRFDQSLNPFAATSVVCPHCGRAGAVV